MKKSIKSLIGKKLLSEKYQEVWLDKHYTLWNMGHLDFSPNLRTKLKKTLIHQGEEIFQLLQLEGLIILIHLKKNIYRTNNIQKVLMPLKAKYTKILMRVSGISGSIYS